MDEQQRIVRTVYLGVRVNEIEKRGAAKLAWRRACTTSELVRELIRRELASEGLLPCEREAAKGARQ
jgi:hypothetical protein